MGIKLKATYETEVFINEPGYLTIRQRDSIGNEPALVMLSPEQAKAVIEEMQRLVGFSDQWWTINEEDLEDEAAG